MMDAFATSFVGLTFEELEAKTTTMVEARAVDQRTDFGRDGAPETYVRFETVDILKGKAASEFELLLPGGMKDGVEYHIHGYPSFETGHTYVLFMEPDPAGFFLIQEAHFGSIQVSEDKLLSALSLPTDSLTALKTAIRSGTTGGDFKRLPSSLAPQVQSTESSSESARETSHLSPRPLDLTQFWILVGLLALALWFFQGRRKL